MWAILILNGTLQQRRAGCEITDVAVFSQISGGEERRKVKVKRADWLQPGDFDIPQGLDALWPTTMRESAKPKLTAFSAAPAQKGPLLILRFHVAKLW
jgi:hypothetical protein